MRQSNRRSVSLGAWGAVLSTACGGAPESTPAPQSPASTSAAASTPSLGSTPYAQGQPVWSGTPGVQLGAVTVQGDLSPKVIFRTVRERTPDFRNCYDDLLKRRPGATSHMVVHFDVNASGNVKDAVYAEQDMGDEALATCVESAFRTLVFPRPTWGPVSVVFPITFAP